jgi:hypothetical protein
MINGRITPEQMEWLGEKAAELGGNLSAALRQAITDARLLEMARLDYKNLLIGHPEFRIPRDDEDGASRTVEIVMSGLRLTDTEDSRLRDEEARGKR